MKILHIVPGTDDGTNGMVVVANLLAKEQGEAEVVDLKDSLRTLRFCDSALNTTVEVWVHGMWLPREWLACWRALKAGKRLVRMTHGSLSPLYLRHQSPFKKWLVGPIERFLLLRCAKIIATCEAEAEWIRAYEPRVKSIEITDIKRFFKLVSGGVRSGGVEEIKNPQLSTSNSQLHLLYLGRRHPLKGVEYLETAVRQIKKGSAPLRLCARIISNAFGEEKDKVWEWCDVLVLPTLSDNFGLVIAEALERGKHVITTDGAPAWGDGTDYGGRLVYLKGYRDGEPKRKVELLRNAIEQVGSYLTKA